MASTYLGLLQIATIYSVNFEQFLAVRSLFGLFMGGVYGNALAMSLENCPHDARGLMSGVMQQGYSLGYVLAACANLGVGGATDSWKTVFWAAAGLSIAAGLARCLFPESKQFVAAKASGHHITAKDFWSETKSMLRNEWRMCVYCIILMTWFNFYSHTSQDSYTTFMIEQKELDNDAASRASIWMKVGACVGGTIIGKRTPHRERRPRNTNAPGHLSQFVGRRRTIVVSALMSCLLIPAWILPEGERSLSGSGFFMQFFVQGAWGVIPIHLNELSPPAYRPSFPGITYQLGNMISSPSAQIVNAISESNFVISKSGQLAEAYGPTMGIATVIIALGIAVTTAFGPEKRSHHFENAGPAGANIGHEADLEKAVDVVSVDGGPHAEKAAVDHVSVDVPHADMEETKETKE
jgi:MFS family permease